MPVGITHIACESDRRRHRIGYFTGSAHPLRRGSVSQRLGAFGQIANPPGSNAARRAFEFMCGCMPVFARGRRGKETGELFRLLYEDCQDFIKQGAVANHILVQVRKIDGRCHGVGASNSPDDLASER